MWWPKRLLPKILGHACRNANEPGRIPTHRLAAMPDLSRHFRRLLTLLAPAIAAILVPACAGGRVPPGADPLPVALDKKANTAARLDAIDVAWAAAEEGRADRAATREAFKTIIWQNAQPAPLRQRAMQRL